jgi:hypothetical protein
VSSSRSARLRRLAEELVECGLPPATDRAHFEVLVEEVDRALRPPIHERRLPSTGAMVDPSSEPSRWPALTQLEIDRTPIEDREVLQYRRFADGLSSWVLRRSDGPSEWLVFDRPSGSERDLVVLASVFDAAIVQRHPSGTVRVAGSFGVLRTRGLDWHHEPPVQTWMEAITGGDTSADVGVLRAILEFAVHDLGAQGTGALLIYRPGGEPAPAVEERLPPPPAVHIGTAFHLAPLRHALAQVDGAAVFDTGGVLRQLGVRVVPSSDAEDNVDPIGGTRHTSARRYSYDDPSAIVVAVSEDGPVTVLRNGEVLGRSATLSS